MKWLFFVLLVCGLCSAAMNKIRLNETAHGEGAVCLDGSTGIYYYKAGGKTNSSKWVLHLMGGGLCMNNEECLMRSKTLLGSSLTWPPQFEYKGPLSEDPSYNPDFHDWNHVFFVYCDGASFSGDRDEPAVVNKTKVHYRGHRNLVATVKDLLETKGLKTATDVLLVGDSAGGMATFFHADEIKNMLPEKIRFKAAPFSGIFLDLPNADDVDFFGPQMKHVCDIQNCSLNAKCVETYTGNESYKCVFGQYAMEFLDTPLFVLDSPYDTIGLLCIVMGEPILHPVNTGTGNCSAIPGWEDCAADTSKCTAHQWRKIEEYAKAYRSVVEDSPKLNKDGNGAYEYSCFTHSIEAGYGWDRVTVHTNKTLMRDAVRAWFFSDNEPASMHTYKDCFSLYSTTCNPTCAEPHSSSSGSSQQSSYSSGSSQQSSSQPASSQPSSSQSSSHAPSQQSSSQPASSAAAFVYPIMAVTAATLLAALF